MLEISEYANTKIIIININIFLNRLSIEYNLKVLVTIMLTQIKRRIVDNYLLF